MATSHLIPDLQFPFDRKIHFHHLDHARREFVSLFDAVDSVRCVLFDFRKVLFEPRRIGVPAILSSIESLGYSATARSGSAENTSLVTQGMAEESLMWRRLFFGSLYWTIPIVLLSMVAPMTPLMDHDSWLKKAVVRGMSVRVALR